jgi:hypothetical protein
LVTIAHHNTTIRFLCDKLWQSVFDEIGEIEDDRSERLRKAVVPIVPGASIVLAVSYVERIFYELKKTVPSSGQPLSPLIPRVGELQKIQSYFGLDPSWYGWPELGNFYRLRHCFAHEFGRLTDHQRPHILAFLRALETGRVREGTTVIAPYFKLEDDEIIMLPGWNDRLRRTLVYFLRLLEPHGLRLIK